MTTKPNPRVWPGSWYATDRGQIIVHEVRAIGRGYQIRGVERIRSDLTPAVEILRRWPQEDFLREMAA